MQAFSASNRSRLSRRTFVMGATALISMPIGQGIAGDQGGLLGYVGTYTDRPREFEGHGEGIYLVRFDTSTTRLTNLGLAAKTPSPSWLTLSRDHRFLYAVNEVIDYDGTMSGSVSAFSIDGASGGLTALNSVSSRGATPAHISLHPSGSYAFVANYFGGNLAVLPINNDGSLGEAVAVETDNGPRNPDHASDDPPGTFVRSDHNGAHVHMVAPDPTGRFVFASDAGLDRLYVWRFDSATGKLTPVDPAFVPVTPGGAPRHFVFHPNGCFFYSLLEHDSKLLVYGLDPANAHLTPLQSVSVLPEAFAGSSIASELVISGDGRFLYAGNRLHDTIAILSVGGNGLVKLIGEVPAEADFPRSMGLTPDGHYLLSCNQRGDSITSFRRDRETGALQFTGDYLPIGSPAVIAFLGGA